MADLATLFVGALCGLCWWAVSLVLGARAYGVVGTNPMVGVIAGVCTGITMAWISKAFYRRSSVRELFWFSPLSVYAAIAIYGLVTFGLRVALNDFHPSQIRWGVGLQNILGMWWGVTFLLHVAFLVHILAYVNHRLLRRMVVGS